MGLIMSNSNYMWTNYNDDLAVKEQRPIAIYKNVHGHIVIRQKGHEGEEDSFVVVKAQNIQRLTMAMSNEAAKILNEAA